MHGRIYSPFFLELAVRRCPIQPPFTHNFSSLFEPTYRFDVHFPTLVLLRRYQDPHHECPN